MATDTILIVEREFDYPRQRVFKALTDPALITKWLAPAGWSVLDGSVVSEPHIGGRFRNTKVNDADPQKMRVIDGIYTEVFDPDVVVVRHRITGVQGVDATSVVELRVEFTKTGRNGTFVRVIQGPYTPEAAQDYSDGWETMLDKLDSVLAAG